MTFRYMDGNEAAGRTLVSNATGDATWEPVSRTTFITNFFQTDTTTIMMGNTTPVKAFTIGNFNKASANSDIELFLQTLVSNQGTGSNINVQLRVDDTPPSDGNAATGIASGGFGGEPLFIYGIFKGLSAGMHSVDIWIQDPAGGFGTSFRVNSDTVTIQNQLIIKELRND